MSKYVRPLEGKVVGALLLLRYTSHREPVLDFLQEQSDIYKWLVRHGIIQTLESETGGEEN